MSKAGLAFDRFWTLSRIMGIDVHKAMGVVLCLWHGTQCESKTSWSRDEIRDWCLLHSISDEETKKWISALIEVRFISEESDGKLFVYGNDIRTNNYRKEPIGVGGLNA